ncbi:MAG: hypothetical protein AVDCRST_MAG13-163, partial [uncultured Solirubrobacteraceae bacterium]
GRAADRVHRRAGARRGARSRVARPDRAGGAAPLVRLGLPRPRARDPVHLPRARQPRRARPDRDGGRPGHRAGRPERRDRRPGGPAGSRADRGPALRRDARGLARVLRPARAPPRAGPGAGPPHALPHGPGLAAHGGRPPRPGRGRRARR